MRFRIFTLFVSIIISFTTAHATIRYVKPAAAGTGNGSSWANASNDIAAMITASASGDQIWIAAGTYIPAATLSMKNGVAIYGGFAGTETALNQRNYITNTVILNGNSTMRVFKNSNLNNTAVLDGVTIINGNASNFGAGMLNYFSNPTISNCKFQNNRAVNSAGGGIYNDGSSPIISNCVFIGNSTTISVGGGGIYNASTSNPIISNCVFENNNSNGHPGAAIFIETNSSATINNSVFTGNSSGSNGGAVYDGSNGASKYVNCVFSGNSGFYGGAIYFASTSTSSLIFCTITNNSGYQGGGIYTSSAGLKVTNSIVFNNTATNSNPNILNEAPAPGPTVTYSNIQGGFTGTGNINANPLFLNTTNKVGNDGLWMTADDGLQVKIGSPCLSAGTTGVGIPTTDILGITRSATTPTMGSYEAGVSNKVFVNTSISSSGNGFTWATAKKTLQEALQLIYADTIWIAAGSYTPTSTLSMRNGLAIIGGFTGTETLLSQRNFAANPTIISGGDVRQVFNNTNLDNTAVLDGCIISNGYIQNNSGAGMQNSSSSPIIRNCIFKDNKADYSGGGMLNSYSSPIISNCVFTNNTATSASGGGIFNDHSSISLLNCVFNGNKTIDAFTAGGGIYNTYSIGIVINNCVFTKNNSLYGGGIYNTASNLTIANTIIYDNMAANGPNFFNEASATIAISNSDIEGGFAGTGNINTDPLFVNASSPVGPDGKWMTADDGLALQPCSPVINAGITTSPALSTDILGNNRIGTYDMGAYEYQGNISGLAPGIGSQNASSTKTQSGTTVYGLCTNSHLIATVLSNGTNPIAGSTTAKLWIEATQTAQFVKRHYEITPAANAATATGKVTLYFTQAEFTDFNTQVPAPALLLPTGPTDAAGKVNLRVEKRAGFSSDGSGLPGTYTGTITTIDPVDADIVWNTAASRWEVSFTVTGFSGFFVKTQITTLPLRWLSVNGYLNSNKEATINWEVQETAVAGYEIEKSLDASSFAFTGHLQSKGDGNNRYQFTENMALEGTAFYRIKQKDINGNITYSPIIKLSSRDANKIQVYPSPFKTGFTVLMDKPQTVELKDMGGRAIQSFTLNPGSNYVAADNLPSGMYFLKTGDGTVLKIQKQ
jgi:hypothetical protein